MLMSTVRATNVASQPMATERDVQRVVDGAHRRALGHLAQRRGRRILPLGQSVDAVVEEHDVDVEITPDGVDQVVAADAQGVAVAGDDPHREVRPREPLSRWPRPGPGRGSSECRRCSCSRGSGWSSRCPRRTPFLPRDAQRGQDLLHWAESSSRRSRGTSALLGRWHNRWPSSDPSAHGIMV